MSALPRTGRRSSTGLLHPLQAAGAFALFAWVTPTHELPWTTFHAEFAMAVAAMLAAACVLWQARRQPVAIPASALATLAIAVIPLLQLAAGKIAFRGDAALACLYLAGFALTQIVGERAVALWGLARVLQAFACLVLIGAVISTWLALCQWQQLDYLGLALVDMPPGSRPFANFNQPNLLATLLVLGLLATAILHDAERFGATVALLLVGLLGFGLAATQSRAGLLGLGVAGVLLLIRRHRLTGRLKGTQVVAGLSTVLLMLFAWQALRMISVDAGGRDASAMVAAGTRYVHWSSMWDAIGRRPWAGYGWNQVDAAQFAVAPDHPATGEVLAYGHNLVLDLLLWNGVPLGAVLAGGLGLWFALAVRGARDSATLLALALVVAVFAHAMVEYPLYYAYFLLPVGLMFGALGPSTAPRAVLRIPGRLAPLLLVPAALALAWLASDYLKLEQDHRSLRYERARIGVDHPPHTFSDPVLLDQLGTFIRFARTPERPGMSEADLASMNAVVLRFPSAPNIVRYAAALSINGRPAAASDALRRVCKMHPERVCEAMKSLWTRLGEREPAIAGVAWPQ